MNHQPDLFPDLGAKLRDSGIRRSFDGAGQEFAEAADAAIRYVARDLGRFTTDDVWKILGKGFDDINRQAMGGAMKRVESAGLIEPTSEWRQSTRPACHCRPVRAWKVKG